MNALYNTDLAIRNTVPNTKKHLYTLSIRLTIWFTALTEECSRFNRDVMLHRKQLVATCGLDLHASLDALKSW